MMVYSHLTGKDTADAAGRDGAYIWGGEVSDDLRGEMAAKYGEAIVADIEAEVAASVLWPCRDTMDGRRWCRVHDASWPSWQVPARGCEVWSAVGSAVEPATTTSEDSR